MHNLKSQTAAQTEPFTFGELFCRASKCNPEDYEKQVLLMCLHPDHSLLARMYFVFDRENYKMDIEMLRHLRKTTNFADFKVEMEAWRSSHPSKGYLRKEMHFRVSGKQLLKLASRLFKSPNFFGLSPRGTGRPSKPAPKDAEPKTAE